MASKQSEAVRRHWTICATETTLEEVRAAGDRWSNLSTEPTGVDYLEVEVGGATALWAVPKGCAVDRVVFCTHGGGYIMGSIYTHRKLFGHLAKAIGCRALIVGYPLTPEHQFPAQSDNTFEAYRWLLDQGIKANHIVVAGDSAGGGLAISNQLRARDAGLPLAAAIMTISAWTDMELSGDSYRTNREKDPLFKKEMVAALVEMLLGPHGDRRHPYASPLYGDLTGLPPLFMQVGGDECLLDDSRAFAERAKTSGVQARIDIFPDMLHTFQMAVGRAPEADDAIGRFAEWVRPKLGLSEAVRAA